MKKGAPFSNRKADCCPDRKHHARGMCRQCYVKYKNSIKFTSIGRKLMPLLCGHDDKNHSSKGFCGACYSKHLRATDPKYSKEARRTEETLRRYGITTDQRDEMIEMQGGKCAICFVGFCEKVIPHIDHCHDSGKIRGILCFSCNKALGMFGDNLAGIQKAVDYLKSPGLFNIIQNTGLTKISRQV